MHRRLRLQRGGVGRVILRREEAARAEEPVYVLALRRQLPTLLAHAQSARGGFVKIEPPHGAAAQVPTRERAHLQPELLSARDARIGCARIDAEHRNALAMEYLARRAVRRAEQRARALFLEIDAAPRFRSLPLTCVTAEVPFVKLRQPTALSFARTR